MEEKLSNSKPRPLLLTSIFLGCAIISVVLPYICRVFDHLHTGPVFSAAIIICLAGIASLFTKQEIRIGLPDLIIFMVYVYALFSTSLNDLWSVAYTTLILLYWIIRSCNGICLRVVLLSSYIALIILLFWGYLQYFAVLPGNHQFQNVTGPYYNSGVYGLILGMLTVPSVAMLSYVKCYSRKFHLILTTLILSAPLLIITQSRTAWVSLSAVLLYLAFAVWLQKHRTTIKKIIVVLCTGILLGAGLFWLYNYKKDSADGRILIWKVSAQMIKENPVKGYGRGGFEAKYMLFQHDYLKSHGNLTEKYVAGNNRLAFNEPIRLWVEYGIAGVILYLVFIGFVINLKTPDSTSVSAKAVVIYFIVSGITHYPAQFFPTLFIAALALAILINRQEYVWRRIRPSKTVTATLTGIFIVGLIVIGINSYPHYSRLHRFLKIIPTTSPEFVIGLSEFDTVMSHHTSFNILYVQSLWNTSKRGEALDTKIKDWERSFPSSDLYFIKGQMAEEAGDIITAQEHYWTAHYMVPSRQKPRTAIALLYMKSGRSEDARQLAIEILEESVKVYSFGTYELHQKLKRQIMNVSQ